AGDRYRATPEELELAEEVPEEIVLEPQAEAEDTTFDLSEESIVRRKHVSLTPMTEEEAIKQMELLSHDFFMFYNADTESVTVLYKRENGGYGLLVPETA